MSLNIVPLVRHMGPRDPQEPHRVASPLELFSDLIFVTAVASAGVQLHHGLAEGDPQAWLHYAMVFLAIWWAWMNFTWFASAYDCDDVGYRLLTFLIMSGALVFAAGVPDLFDDGQSFVGVLGYAIMRLGMVGMWLRAAKGDPDHRRTALGYAVGIFLVQLLWIGRLAIHGQPELLLATFFVGMAAELAVPPLAEGRNHTPFHPHHIAERYGLFTIIVLGEVILSSVQAVQGALGAAGHDAEAAAHGPAPQLLLLIVGALLIVFSLWWIYFKREHADLFESSGTMFAVGYGHYFILASVAASGAAIAAAIDVLQHEAHASQRSVALALAAPIAVYVIMLGITHFLGDRDLRELLPSVAVAVALLVIVWIPVQIGTTVLLIGGTLALAVAWLVIRTNRQLGDEPGS